MLGVDEGEEEIAVCELFWVDELLQPLRYVEQGLQRFGRVAVFVVLVLLARGFKERFGFLGQLVRFIKIAFVAYSA